MLFEDLFWYENQFDVRVRNLQKISKKTKWKRNRRGSR